MAWGAFEFATAVQRRSTMKFKHIFTLGLALALSVAAAAQSDTQKSFEKLKTLAGSWDGTVHAAGTPMDGAKTQVTLRVTSLGNTLMHEMRGDGPDDPITMITVDGDKLRLTHYCDAGNQPHMVGTVSPDGKTITFNFVDATNLLAAQGGHMQSAVFTFIDADHHTEKWDFAMNDGKSMGGLIELQRRK
jgi:hypothetical protein